MKKWFLMAAVAVVSFSAVAEGPVLDGIKEEFGIFKAKWSPFQFAVTPARYGLLFSSTADIYGLALGVFLLEQKSAVISVALTSGQVENYGLQCAAVTIAEKNYGLNVGGMVSFIRRNYGVQIGGLNVEADGGSRRADFAPGAPGVQIGVFNVGHGLQIGALNYNPDALIPVLPIFNYSE